MRRLQLLLSALVSSTVAFVQTPRFRSLNGHNIYIKTLIRASVDTSVDNEFWSWRGQNIRYVAHGEENLEGPCVIMVHGLFVNADHFRKNLPELANAGFRAYGIDLLGSGYSSKPPPTGDAAQKISGESTRSIVQSGLSDVELGTANGGTRRSDVALAHPVQGSVYNFYT